MAAQARPVSRDSGTKYNGSDSHLLAGLILTQRGKTTPCGSGAGPVLRWSEVFQVLEAGVGFVELEEAVGSVEIGKAVFDRLIRRRRGGRGRGLLGVVRGGGLSLV